MGSYVVMDADAGELWEKHSGELIRFASSLVGPVDAEDVLSSAFVAAVSSTTWSSVRNRRAYLFRAVASHAGKLEQSRRRRLRREELVARTDLSLTPADVEALSLLTRLTVRQRAVVWMAYWLDANTGEIAEMLELSRRTVERELTVARRRIRKELS